MSSSKPLRPKRGKAAATANFTEVVANAKVAKAKKEALMARLEAIDTLLEDAEPYDVLLVCAQALAHAFPLCCEKHEDEFKAEFLRVLNDCLDGERDAAEAEGDGEGDPHPQVH